MKGTVKMVSKQSFAFCAVALVIIATGVGYAVGVHPASVQKDWVDYATAIGTVGAALAAVGIAVRQEQVRRYEAELKANLVAARISPTLSRFIDWIRTGTGGLDFSDLRDNTYCTPGSLFQTLRSCGSVQVTLDELASLAPLPNRAAYRLARALSLYSLLFEELETTVRTAGPEQAGKPMSEESAHGWSNRIDEILALLEIAARECVKAAAVPAETPSGQERYGPPY